MLPGILTQLGPEGLNQLKRLANNVIAGNKLLSSVQEDDDVPALVENFEDTAKKDDKPAQTNYVAEAASVAEPAIEKGTFMLLEFSNTYIILCKLRCGSHGFFCIVFLCLLFFVFLSQFFLKNFTQFFI